MKFMLKTLGISIVLAFAGCASTSSSSAPSLSAADDAPVACSAACSAACSTACKAAFQTKGAAGETITCQLTGKQINAVDCPAAKAKAQATCGPDCTKPCCTTKATCGPDCTKPCCADKASSLGAFNDDAAKTKSSCCPGAKENKTGGCPFSGKKQ